MSWRVSESVSEWVGESGNHMVVLVFTAGWCEFLLFFQTQKSYPTHHHHHPSLSLILIRTDLALGPAPAIKSKPSRAPKGSNAKKTHGVVGLPPLPGSLQADSSIITDDGGGDRDYDREGEEGEAASPNVRFDDEEG